MSYEVELKFKISDPAPVKQALESLGGKPTRTETEMDCYFEHPARSFEKTDEALRVRQAGSQIFLTYKGPKVDRTTKTRIEIEPEIVPGPTAASDVTRLLEHLGFSSVGEVCKSRTDYHVRWMGENVKVSLDSVKNLGDFVELEMASTEKDLEKCRQRLFALSKRLNLNVSQRRSYLELLCDKSRSQRKMH